MKTNEHKFWCINCGKAGIPIQRKVGHQHGKNHRKKLWCPWCLATINMVETRNTEEEAEFLENFKNGVYKDEVADSLAMCGNSRLG